MTLYLPSIFMALLLLSCTSSSDSEEKSTEEKEDEGEEDGSSSFPDGAVPLFIIAGQSNAEGNVRLTGLEAIRDALPAHDSELSSSEREAVRDAYRQGVGDWCNPDEDYSDESADVSVDALRAGQLDLSMVSENYTIENTFMAAYRWRFQEAEDSLGEPYQSTLPNPHPAHTTDIVPLGVGFGVWDDEESETIFYGPELGFGMQIQQSTSLEAFDVLKVAMGGSSLFAHWAPEGPMLQQLYERTDSFLSQRTDSAVAGLIWFQGFNDQFEDQARENYAANLGLLIDTFRETYGTDLPVVIVQARKVGDLSQIADAQQTVVDTMEHLAIVESDGLSECFHYDAVSQLVIGQRSAEAMMNLFTK